MGTIPFLEEWKMKAGNCWRWRPAMGVMVASALAFAVSVQGGPRVTDGKTALNKGRAKSDTARLVTGPSDIADSVVAGVEASGEIMLTPVMTNANGDNFAGVTYGPGNISGQTITVDAGGIRIYWNVQVTDWDPDHTGVRLLRSTSGRLDSKQFQGDNAVPSNPGCDLGVPSEACANVNSCKAAFNCLGPPTCGEAVAGFCNWGWINATAGMTTRGDGTQWVHSNTFLSVNAGWGLTSPTGPLVFTTTDPSEPRLDSDDDWDGVAENDGTVYYLATYANELPACAKGTYTLSWLDAETFFGDQDNSSFPLVAAHPGVITVPVGRCCYGIGSPAAGCVEDLTVAECAALAQPSVWDDTKDCTEECCACLVPSDCGTDQCFDYGCSNCICSSSPIADWDAGECCDAATGDTCTPTPANTCQTAACSIAPDRGVCVNTSIAEGQPCADPGDDNPCSYDDVCAADESCSGTDVNSASLDCVDDADCLAQTGLTAPVCINEKCECSLVPDLTISKVESDNKDGHCYDGGENGDKVTVFVDVAAATAPINGGQFLITYDPTCLDYNSAAGVNPYTDAVYGPMVDEAAGTIFIVVGVGFGGVDGPAGNASMLSLSFDKIGECDSCQICFDDNNPENTYLVDNTGQRIGVNPICSKAIMADGDVEVIVPGSQRNLNVDCDQPTKTVTWDWPYATDTCGESTISCWGEHESGALYGEGMAMKGGELPIGVSNFCCYAQSDWCGDWDGCAPGMDCPPVPSDKEGFFDVDGCWTIDINDETSLDIELQLSPTADAKPGDGKEACIKFTLYPNTIQEPVRFNAPVTFGELGHIGKVKDKIKIPGDKQWDCISAWDQLHTLRACYLFALDGSDCIDGQLQASFTGDPLFGGNWLIGGNLDGWKKDVAGAEPSLFVIDVLDYGTFVAEWGADYGDGSYDCSTPGPNADIDRDGDVDMDDYAFIQMNFLASAKMCCGVEGLPAAGLTEISVRELRQRGLGNLAVADLNGDGMLDMSDMQAFAQGVRPVTKGTRSGIR